MTGKYYIAESQCKNERIPGNENKTFSERFGTSLLAAKSNLMKIHCTIFTHNCSLMFSQLTKNLVDSQKKSAPSNNRFINEYIHTIRFDRVNNEKIDNCCITPVIFGILYSIFSTRLSDMESIYI